MLAFFLTHWVQFNYTGEPGTPWYHAATWPNVFVLAITLTLGYVWSRTKYWPLRPIKHALEGVHTKLDAHGLTLANLHTKITAHGESHAEHAQKLDALAERVEDLHAKHDKANLDLLAVARLVALAVYTRPISDELTPEQKRLLKATFDEGLRKIIAGEEAPILGDLFADHPTERETP